jgi:CRISPR-associated endoribonuclease Cas6
VAGPPVLRSVLPWVELEASPTVRAWQLEFVTPTTFRNGQRTSPWPAPSSVLTGLAVRWSGLRGSGAPVLTHGVSSSVWVSDVEGRSEALELKQTVVSGFVGRIRYVCDGSDDEAAVVSALFAFAGYAGIGSHTAFGLGAVRLARTWQPRRAPAVRAAGAELPEVAGIRDGAGIAVASRP